MVFRFLRCNFMQFGGFVIATTALWTWQFLLIWVGSDIPSNSLKIYDFVSYFSRIPKVLLLRLKIQKNFATKMDNLPSKGLHSYPQWKKKSAQKEYPEKAYLTWRNTIKKNCVCFVCVSKRKKAFLVRPWWRWWFRNQSLS